MSARTGRSSSIRPSPMVRNSQQVDDGILQPDQPESNADGGEEVPQKPSRGPVAVGRSLEISVTPEMCMEQLVDKLKLLDYEKDFCRRKKPYRKPLSRLYFALPLPSGSQSEQFFYFTGLASWLIGLAGGDLPAPKMEDDPNMSCNSIIAAARKLGFASPGFTPIKLTAGNGKEVCGVLDALADYVLEKRNFTFKLPKYQADTYPEEAADTGDAEDDQGGELEEDFAMPNYEDAQEEEAYMEAGLAPPPGGGGNKGGAGKAEANAGVAAGTLVDKQMLTSNVDPTAWRLELEKVAPRLRILLTADTKDWRTNLEEVHNNSKSISTAWPESRGVLEKLRSDLNGSLEKLTTREKYLNEQFERQMQQYRAQRVALQNIQVSYNQHTEAISDRNNELHRISEQLSEMKQQMEERGTNISDATPVVRIKGAIKKLADELHEMEVRIGVVSNTLLQLSLKNRRLLQNQAVMSDEDDI
ncbi:hypothetical protein CEUSTIGMA_g2499.t1 [Chlamydomonas eustigma]|uniref:Intraflagellar transport protein 57 n=1 Tax=Chlamydomonas eustigma TaxID=1157962 RepID=A0A250WW84_9CHLO|nr:hypothetical protein CEUSTIGMA_g2499.t1 [Chlamydomonas eustigma]|eukprot:GAX75055.1 hypothetical protein CEUSTIGMA_g2499.t1 [Chlamydomonas eustigma]